MPVQRYDTDDVERPSGLIPPRADLAGVTELRVHGVGGTTPASLLGDDAPLQVAGDRISGFYRTADVKGRHVEAYSWGGITSRSGSRVLWVLLLPFALVNLAGWMCTPKTHAERWRFLLHRAAVRLAALGMTINFVAIAVLMFLDVTAYQCGGQDVCTTGRWWLAPFRDLPVVDHPGRRVVLGLLPVLVIVTLLALLTRNAQSRYEAIQPPWRDRQPESRSVAGAALRGRDLTASFFWDGMRCARRLGRAHIAVTLAFLAIVVAHVASTTTLASGAGATATWLWFAVLVAGGTAIAGSLVLLTFDVGTRDEQSPLSSEGLARLALYVAGGALLAGMLYAWLQPAWTPDVVGWAPGIRNVSRYTWVAAIGTVGAVAAPTALGGSVARSFRWGAAFTAALGSVILNLVGLAVLLWYAVFVAPVSYRAPVAMSGAMVYVSSVIGSLLPALMFFVLVWLVCFAAYQGVRYWRAGRDAATLADIRREYEKVKKPPVAEDGWSYSIFGWKDIGIDERSGKDAQDRWVRRIARARRAANVPRELPWLVYGLVLIGVVAAVYAWVGRQLPAPGWVALLGSRIVTVTPLIVLAAVRNGWNSVEKRRRLGILWDVGTFWPRAYHPLAPPCYAERAVPELQRRVWRLHDSDGAVLIAAHSQGAVIGAAALLQVDKRPNDARVALVTFGAPLRKLYQWAFPYYFRDEIVSKLRDQSKLSTWRNFSYATDYIGGHAVSTHDNPVDEDLADPLTSWLVYGQPPPSVVTHSGYWTDPVMWGEIDGIATELADDLAAASAAGPARSRRPPPPGRGIDDLDAVAEVGRAAASGKAEKYG